jgi:hypothetical protein
VDHRIEHLGRGDHRRACAVAASDDPLLDHGDVLQWALDAEVAAGDHDAVGRLDDPVQVRHRAGALDFRDNRDVGVTVFEGRADLDDVVGPPDETGRDEVDARIRGEVEFRPVCRGHQREAEIDAGDVHPRPAPEFAARADPRGHPVPIDLGHGGLDPPVVEHHHVARPGRREARRNADFPAVDPVGGDERDRVARVERDGGLDRGRPHLRPLQVQDDGDRPVGFLVDRADGADQLPAVRGRAVTRVQAGDRHPGDGQVPDGLSVVGGRPQCTHDLRLPFTHGSTPPAPAADVRS